MSTAGSIRRPIQIAEFKTAIRDLPQDQLSKIRQELQNSIKHLDRSNARLTKYIARIQGKKPESNVELEGESDEDTIDANDLQLYQDSLRENEIVLRNHYARLDALDQEEAYRSSGSTSASESEASRGSAVAAAISGIDTDNTQGDANAPNSVFL